MINLLEEIETIEKNQTNILELKTELKNSIESFKIRLSHTEGQTQRQVI